MYFDRQCRTANSGGGCADKSGSMLVNTMMRAASVYVSPRGRAPLRTELLLQLVEKSDYVPY